MDYCLSQEMELDHMKAELLKLKAWKMAQEKKLVVSEQLRGEQEKQMKELKKVLENMEREIRNDKDQSHQAEEDAIWEYRDTNALRKDLSDSYVDGFDYCFRLVKASFPDLNPSHILINAQAQTKAQLVYSESTDKLFADENTIDP